MIRVIRHVRVITEDLDHLARWRMLSFMYGICDVEVAWVRSCHRVIGVSRVFFTDDTEQHINLSFDARGTSLGRIIRINDASLSSETSRRLQVMYSIINSRENIRSFTR